MLKCSCGAQTDAFACKRCSSLTARRLLDLADLLSPHALDEKRAGVRGVSYTGTSGKSSETPLPFNPRVTEAVSAAHGTLVSVWRELTEDEPSLIDDLPRGADDLRLAVWLSAQVMPHIRFMPQAEDIFDDIAEKHSLVVRMWDNPPALVFLGTCFAPFEGRDGHCLEAIYAEQGASLAVCKRCGAQHEASAMLAKLEARCAEYEATLKDIAHFLAPMYGNRAKRRRLIYLAECGRLEVTDERPEWMSDGSIRRVKFYRVGDVIEQIHLDISDEAKRKAQREAKRTKAA